MKRIKAGIHNDLQKLSNFYKAQTSRFKDMNNNMSTCFWLNEQGSLIEITGKTWQQPSINQPIRVKATTSNSHKRIIKKATLSKIDTNNDISGDSTWEQRRPATAIVKPSHTRNVVFNVNTDFKNPSSIMIEEEDNEFESAARFTHLGNL